MNKRKIITFIWSSIIFASLASGLLASVAWFASANKFDVDITGSVVEEYFHTGNGTQNNPFVITRPIHYYHLVEFFQRETALDTTAEFGTDYLYFQVGYDLDNDGDLDVFDYDDQGIYQGTSESPSYSQTLNMAYYSGSNALMPIGTNEVPFIGVFDGKANEGIVISNLNIHCAETVIVGNNQVNRAASDIGMFGYVADKDGSNYPTIIKNMKVDGLNIDLTDVTSTVASPTTSIAHTDAHAGVAYVGYIAGHVHSYTNYSSTGPTNAAPLYNVYVTNAKIEGGAGTTCGFGYIGLVDTVDGEEPTAVESQVSTTHGSGSGQGNSWGGSFNFKEFNSRLNYFVNNTTMDIPDLSNGATGTSVRFRNYFWSKDYSDDYKFSLYRNPGSTETSSTKNNGNRNYYATNPNSGQVIYNLIGKYDGNWTVATSSSQKKTTSISIPGTIQPLNIDENYDALDSNTGYILGGNGTPTANSNGQNSMVPYVVSASHPIRFLNNSTNDTVISDANVYNNIGSFVGYNKAKLEILTPKKNASYSSSNYVLIKDELEGYNSGHTPTNSNISSYTKDSTTTPTALGLTKYNSSRGTLDEIFSSNSYIHGMHFRGSNSDAASVYINTTKTFTADSVLINGQTYSNYTFPTSCIDFNLKEEGKINLFSGSYYYQNTDGVNSTNSFMSLWKVNRTGTTLNSVQQIKRIFKSNDQNASEKYIYDYTGSTTPSDATLVFDVRFLNNAPPVKNALYYFEIPVNMGEYAIGVSDNSVGGAYLMYLDIGTSGENQQQTHNQTISIADAALFSQIDFQIDNFVTNSCFNVAFVVPEGATKETFSVTVSSGDVVYEGEDYFCYEIVIVNTTQHDFVISALLMDDDSDPNNDYFYMYAIKYNTGARTEYTSSNTYTGVSGGTTLTPTHT